MNRAAHIRTAAREIRSAHAASTGPTPDFFRAVADKIETGELDPAETARKLRNYIGPHVRHGGTLHNRMLIAAAEALEAAALAPATTDNRPAKATTINGASVSTTVNGVDVFRVPGTRYAPVPAATFRRNAAHWIVCRNPDRWIVVNVYSKESHA